MFDKAIVLGTGTTALKCAEVLLKKGITPEVYCADKTGVSMVGGVRRLLGNEAAERLFTDKTSLTECLSEEVKKTLIISSESYYIIPKIVLEKENITAVNFHNACLPFYPGRNAEAWSIFEGNTFSGITWHYMVPQVDKGPIIIQEKIKLTPETTSLSLLRQQKRLAVDSFAEMIDGLLAGNINSVPQNEAPGVKMHYSWERPNDGKLDLQWDSDKISAFLRCYDYGLLHTLGVPVVDIDKAYYKWEGYKISRVNTDREFFLLEDSTITIQKGSTLFQLANVKKTEEFQKNLS